MVSFNVLERKQTIMLTSAEMELMYELVFWAMCLVAGFVVFVALAAALRFIYSKIIAPIFIAPWFRPILRWWKNRKRKRHIRLMQESLGIKKK